MYDVGDVVPLSFDVVDPVTQSLVADSVASLTISGPGGPDGLDDTEYSPPVSSPANGRFVSRFVPPFAGRYTVRWAGVDSGTSAAVTAYTDVINVSDAVTAALISLAEAREHLNIPAGERVEDNELRGYIMAATVAVEEQLGQVVARRTITDYIDVPTPLRRLYLKRNPVLRLISLATLDGSTTWDVDTLVLDAATGMVDTVDGDPLCGRLRLVYTAGYRLVTPNIILATQIIVAHLWQTQRVSSITPAPGFGGDDAAGPIIGLGFALPNRALELLGGRPPVIA